MGFSKKITESEAKHLDIIFLVDTSGSMASELDSVKQSCINFANRIIKENKSVQLGLIGFDIGGHRPVNKNLNYQVYNLSAYTIGIWQLSSPNEFKQNISTLSLGLFGGGGCYLADRNSVDIFPYVASSFTNKSNSKILVLVSDEMGGKDGLADIVNILNSNDIEAYVMGVSGADEAHESIAKQTGGKFWDINKSRGVQDFSELLNNAADEIVNSIAEKMRRSGLSEEFITQHVSKENKKSIIKFGAIKKPAIKFGPVKKSTIQFGKSQKK